MLLKAGMLGRLRWPHDANHRVGGVFLCASLSEEAMPTGNSGEGFPSRSAERDEHAAGSHESCPISPSRVGSMIED
jgi:hypothetical protein